MKVRVIKSTGSWYICQTADGKRISCRIVGKFRLQDLKVTNPIAVGDFVEIELEVNQENGIITQIHERNNYIIRKSPRHPGKNHIIAANLDQLFVIVTIKKPRTSSGFIDRMLMVAEMHHIPATIVFNKKDLLKTKDLEQFELWKKAYQEAGYGVELISALDEADTDKLKTLLAGKTTLVCGHSGVGKSTLINQFIPDLNIATKEISAYHEKGTHTTTFAEMHPLEGGGYIVDTPGIKELAAVDIEPEEVSHYFPEMRERLNDCKFNNCLHQNEPKCAIKAAFVEGIIAEFRFENYLKIVDDLQAISYWKR